MVQGSRSGAGETGNEATVMSLIIQPKLNNFISGVQILWNH